MLISFFTLKTAKYINFGCCSVQSACNIVHSVLSTVNMIQDKQSLGSPCPTRLLHHCKHELFSNSALINNCAQQTEQRHKLVIEASTILRNNQVIAVPTDTIYGIAALAQSTEAVNKLYSIKERDLLKPIAICLDRIESIPKYCIVDVPKQLLRELLPGPVTLVFQRNEKLNPLLNPETSLVGVRIPNNPLVCEIAKNCDQPLALTSANTSSQTSPLSVQEFKHLWPDLGLIIDGGTLGEVDPNRLGSTVVDLSVPGQFHLIRSGCAEESTLSLLLKYNLKEKL